MRNFNTLREKLRNNRCNCDNREGKPEENPENIIVDGHLGWGMLVMDILNLYSIYESSNSKLKLQSRIKIIDGFINFINNRILYLCFEMLI